MRIELDHVTIERDGDKVTTTLKADGAQSVSINPGGERQLEICGWVGCGADLSRYNFEHEFLHSFVAQKMHGRVSYVVGMDAHGKKMSEVGAWYEERWIYHFHCAVNGRGALLEPEWHAWVPEARTILADVYGAGAHPSLTKGPKPMPFYGRPDYDKSESGPATHHDGEPVFVLKARDMNAPNTIRHWAYTALGNGASREIFDSAMLQANAMEAWAKEHGGRKVPDLPKGEA